MPLTTPIALIVATLVLLVLHVPPEGVADTVAVEPEQVLTAPDIGDIEVVTVINAVA